MIEIFHSLKYEDFINELGKNIFHWGKRNIPKGILPIPQNIWPKGP